MNDYKVEYNEYGIMGYVIWLFDNLFFIVLVIVCWRIGYSFW